MIRPEELDARARLLRAAVGFALVPPMEPKLRLLHRWFDSWRGVGDVVVGMHRQGYDVQLTQYDERGWADPDPCYGPFYFRRVPRDTAKENGRR